MNGFNSKRTLKSALLGGVALAIIVCATGASAQDAAPAAEEKDKKVEKVIVTGTAIRGNLKSVSPLTTITADEMEKKGVNTVQDAIQNANVNNGPAIVNGWQQRGFTPGASGASLRGLTSSSTLVLFDGLRASYYPLGDDASRNFVDLNTIPDDIVDRVEILRDGASSTYGADAIGGVINIITKREFQGVAARFEAGVSGGGFANQDRESLTMGTGDLGEDGYNFYLSGFRISNDKVMARDLPYPFNTYNWTDVCYEGNCDADFTINAIQPGGAFLGVSTASNFLLRPATLGVDGLTTTPLVGSRFQHANTTADRCGPGGTLTALSPAQLASTGGAIAPLDGVCQYDQRALFGLILPEIERWGLSARGTATIENLNSAEAYFEFNFMQAEVSGPSSSTAVFAGTANTGIFYPRFSTASNSVPPNAVGSRILFLPVYVCPERVNCAAIPANLNPQNPFAGAGQVARIIGRDYSTEVPQNSTDNRSYRFAAGLSGEFDNGWEYDLTGTIMHTDLDRTSEGYVYIQHLLDVIADGTYNFANPSANTQAVKDYLMPKNVQHSTSDQVQLQAQLTVPVFELDGGTARLAVGATSRYEAIDSPSGNSDFFGPTQRWQTLNAFGAVGSRRVHAAFAELNMPVLDNLDVNLSGRFDAYSGGQEAFSPKIGARWEALDMLTLRATYSEGFRIPAFAEANSLPSTGFVTNSAVLFNDLFLANYGCSVATFVSCPAYIRGSYGLTTLANPDLQPEESSSLTLGAIVEPFKGLDTGGLDLNFTVDYYHIEKTNAIAPPTAGTVIQDYYLGLPTPPQFVITPDAVDPNFPFAPPRIATVGSKLENADTWTVEGWDFSVNLRGDVSNDITFSSSLDASYIARLTTLFADGHLERYDGTLGNNNFTAGTGTPAWRGNWTTTVFFADLFDMTATANYYSGYNLSAMDQGTGYKDDGLCSGFTPCDIDAYITVDIGGRAHVSENATLYFNVLNVADEMPPVDIDGNYGLSGYNPVVAGNGIMGRYFRAGVKVSY